MKTFNSAFSNSSSVMFREFSFGMERTLLSIIQGSILNTIAVQVASIQSASNGTSIRVTFEVIVIHRTEITTLMQRKLLYDFVKTIVTSSEMTSSYSVSTSMSFSYLRGW